MGHFAKRAEASGFTHAWVFDSPALWREPFVILVGVLAETKRQIVGQMVTDPGSRDRTVLASTFAIQNDAYCPRTILSERSFAPTPRNGCITFPPATSVSSENVSRSAEPCPMSHLQNDSFGRFFGW